MDQLIKSVKLTDAIKEFTIELSLRNLSEKTIAYYKQHLGYFLKQPLPELLSEITRFHIKEYLAMKQSAKYVMHGSFRALRAFFYWAVAEEYIEKSPMHNMKAPKLPEKIVPTITNDSMYKLMSTCDESFLGIRDRAILAILYDTGVRISELTGMKYRDLDMENRIIRIIGKGNREACISFNPKAAKDIWRYIKAHKGISEHLWLTKEKRALDNMGVSTMLRRRCEQCGIGRISAHKFRHTFAVNFLRNGGDIFNLQTLLRHKSIEMVKNYSKTLNNDDAIKAARKFSPYARL